MKIVGTDEVAEGLFESMKAHPQLRAEVALSPEAEPASIALLLAAARGDWSAWDLANEVERGTACGLMLDFFAKVMHPRPGEMLGRRWQVMPGTLEEMAWQVVAAEIARSHPQQSAPH